MTLPPFAPIDALTAALGADDLPAEQVIAGSPRVASLALATVGGAEVGIWELSAGTVRDVEVDEVFVVLEGRATVTIIDDGRETSVDLSPGTTCRLTAGMATTWQVHEKLRKVYVIGDPA